MEITCPCIRLPLHTLIGQGPLTGYGPQGSRGKGSCGSEEDGLSQFIVSETVSQIALVDLEQIISSCAESGLWPAGIRLWEVNYPEEAVRARVRSADWVAF